MSYDTTMTGMITKIRALTEDFQQTSVEVFTYETSNVFTLAEPRVSVFTEALVNGQELESAEEATFDEDTNEVTISNYSFSSGDIVSLSYTFTNLSDSEIFEYVRAALVWLSIYDPQSPSYVLKSTGLMIPTPTTKTQDLICIIAAILIKPDYISYKTANMAVTYPNKTTKEDKIKLLVQDAKFGTGYVTLITYNREIE